MQSCKLTWKFCDSSAESQLKCCKAKLRFLQDGQAVQTKEKQSHVTFFADSLVYAFQCSHRAKEFVDNHAKEKVANSKIHSSP